MTSSYHHQMMSPRRWTQSIVGRTAEGRAQCQEAAAPKVYCLCEVLVRVGLKLLKKKRSSWKSVTSESTTKKAPHALN